MTRATALPDDVRQALVDAGKLTGDGLGQASQLRTCPRCRRWVVVGLDDRRCAVTVTCDPVVLDPYGEAAALLAGRRTFELWGREIERRDQWKIRAGQRKPVIAEHDCGATVKPTPSIISLFIPRIPTMEASECPF